VVKEKSEESRSFSICFSKETHVRLFIALFFLITSLSLAQSLSGTYTFQDDTGERITLTLEEKADGTFTGSLNFSGMQTPVQGEITGAGTATGNFVQEAGEDTPAFSFTLELKEPQLLFTAADTGDVLTLTRGSAITTTTQPTEPSETTLPDDPKLQECQTFLESDEAATDTAKVQECQTYVQTVLGTGDEGDEGSDIGVDAEELAYCQDFLADAEAVAEDPEEKLYCEDYIKTFGTAQPQTTPTETTQTTENNPLTTENPLNPGGAENPLTTKLDAFSGIYRGENIALTVQLANGQYTGTLDFNGQSYPVQASEQESKLIGTFQVNGSPYDFVFYLQDTFFTLESGGQTYNLMKQP
jgi:hypothetical protein